MRHFKARMRHKSAEHFCFAMASLRQTERQVCQKLVPSLFFHVVTFCEDIAQFSGRDSFKALVSRICRTHDLDFRIGHGINGAHPHIRTYAAKFENYFSQDRTTGYSLISSLIVVKIGKEMIKGDPRLWCPQFGRSNCRADYGLAVLEALAYSQPKWRRDLPASPV